ncbi:hypothetical protein HK101_000774 [Irineochytrium annulatum]|nr:hypothetical protein HK101_000774 [Irineochytrium annulatum]
MLNRRRVLQTAVAVRRHSAAAALPSHAGITVSRSPLNPLIAHVALTSPPVNALTQSLLSSLTSTLRELSKSGAKGIVLSTGLGKVFSAGLDLTALIKSKEESDREYKDRLVVYLGAFQDAVKELLLTELPTVAFVEGTAPAGGTVLALCCDYRMAPINTGGIPWVMGLNETAVGMAPPLWVHRLAQLALPPRTADHILQRGLLFSTPTEAHSLGLIDALVPRYDYLRHAGKEIETLQRVPWGARVDAKRRARKGIVDAMDIVAIEELHDCLAGEEFQGVVGGIMEGLRRRKEAVKKAKAKST